MLRACYTHQTTYHRACCVCVCVCVCVPPLHSRHYIMHPAAFLSPPESPVLPTGQQSGMWGSPQLNLGQSWTNMGPSHIAQHIVHEEVNNISHNTHTSHTTHTLCTSLQYNTDSPKEYTFEGGGGGGGHHCNLYMRVRVCTVCV